MEVGKLDDILVTRPHYVHFFACERRCGKNELTANMKCNRRLDADFD